MSEPATPFFKRSVVFDWLIGAGYARWKVRQLIEDGTIRKNALGYYSREQIRQDVLNLPAANNESATGPAAHGATQKEKH